MRLFAYLLASLLLALAPGPDNCFVLTQSAAYGFPAGMAVTLGLISGLCVHITLAVLGVAEVLNRFPRAGTLISALGAGYLFYVAWQMWGSGLATAQAEAGTLASFYLKGILLNLSNPKVILFFIAFLPRFLPEGCRNRQSGLFLLGALFALCAFTVMGSFALAGGALARFLERFPAAAPWVNRITAVAVAMIASWILLKLRGGAAEAPAASESAPPPERAS
ncbi:MAG: LysE family translocator [Candidatus Spyradenecus sp.]